MWKGTWSSFWIGVLCLFQTLATAPESIPLGERSVLVYRTRSGQQESQFVLRLARFHPDIFLEWESASHQGTLHLHRAAVRSARRMTLSDLFEVGVDQESSDTMTKWLPLDVYQSLMEEGSVKLNLNRLSAQFRLSGQGTATLKVDQREVTVATVEVQDSRGGAWVFWKDPNNPLLLRYTSRFYLEELESVSTPPKSPFRWIRRLPPVQ